MPLDYENLTQYKTLLRCPECSEHIFQTDAQPTSALAFVEAECTNCGHALTAEEIGHQMQGISPEAFNRALASS